MFNPFDEIYIKHIFRRLESDNNRLKTRESTRYEFKENFNIANMSKYAKTMSSFANYKGGYIIFGISDYPRTLNGMSNNRLEEADEGDMTNFLNGHFAPSILWVKEIITIDGKDFGLIYTYESESKPVVCIKNNGKTLKDTDIYYRYSGRSECIKYPELRNILDLEKNKEKKVWMDLIQNIVDIGPDRVALLDLEEKSFSGEGGKLYLDKNIIDEIIFIKEGEFNEVEGAKTLRVIGNVEEISGTSLLSYETIETVYENIRETEIITSFLTENLNTIPANRFLDALTYEKTKFLPIYFFLFEDNLSISDFIDIINSSDSMENNQKEKLKERINENRNYRNTLDNKIIDENTYFIDMESFNKFIEKDNKALSKKRALFYNLILSDDADYIKLFINLYSKEICEAICGLNEDQVMSKKDFIKNLLSDIYRLFYSDNTSIRTAFRYTISFLDELLYKSKIPEE
jgi:hypothetical protein